MTEPNGTCYTAADVAAAGTAAGQALGPLTQHQADQVAAILTTTAPANGQKGRPGGLPCAPAAPDGHQAAQPTERNPTQ